MPFTVAVLATSDHKKRRAQKRSETKPKQLHSLMSQLGAAQFQQNKTNKNHGEIMKAKCNRLKERSLLVGRTVFSFDSNGVCTVDGEGRPSTVADFAQLLKLNGVEELFDIAIDVPEGMSAKEAEEKLQKVLGPEVTVEEVVTDNTPAPEEKVDEPVKEADPVVAAEEPEKAKEEKPKKRRGRRKKELD